MRIGQISPLSESVPPRCYGGTERVVHYLTEELVRRDFEKRFSITRVAQQYERLYGHQIQAQSDCGMRRSGSLAHELLTHAT